MIVVNIHEAKAKLSEYLEAVGRGERVLICKRNRPVAELRATPSARTKPRPLGGGPHEFGVPDQFFEPMPDEWVAGFESGPVYPEAPSSPRRSRVAEDSSPYAKKRRSTRKTHRR